MYMYMYAYYVLCIMYLHLYLYLYLYWCLTGLDHTAYTTPPPGRQNSLPCPLPSYEEYIVISLTRDLKRVPPGCGPRGRYIAQGRLDDSEVLDSPF